MSNINKIKAYIEGLYDGEAPKHAQQCDFDDGYFTGIGAISKFIDSLPEEIPPYCTGIKGDPDPAGTSDLEEEIQGMYQAIFGTDIINRREMVYLETFDMIARHFANWQKEQMMKEAVEGEIVKDISNKLVVTAKNINLDGFKFGDTAKIIIVKQDDRQRD